MRRNCLYLLGLCALLSANSFGVARAQQLRPYFLVIVDTSGSMAWCAGGNTQQNGLNDCSCHENNNCNAAFKTNRCGFEANKLGDAKCALQRILDGVGGDATFGLMQFEHPCDNACQPSGGACSGTLNACGAECDDAQLAVEITSGNANLMREWVDGECQGSCGANDFRHELTVGQWTPLARSLQRANEYLRGQSSAISGWPYVTGMGVPDGPLANDSQLACRPVSVILLTDGDDTCVPASQTTTAAPLAAATLNTGDIKASSAAAKAFRTYVIGFGSSGGNFNPAVLNDIASRGGTDAGDPSGNRYFAAQNERELSIALSRIIADAQPPVEVCNNADDDCDGNSDEGLPKFCNKPAGVDTRSLCDEPDESQCDGVDDDCDGVVDEGLTNACGACGDVPMEVCDSVDNDCDSRVDEDTNNMQSCGKATGECKTGQLVCVEGSEQCKGEIGPSDERCDCKDNDCDGSTDEENPNPLCDEGERCAGCNCVQFCDSTVEFSLSCPDGLRPDVQPNGECLCVVDNCDAPSCMKETHESDGEVYCAPDDSHVAPCLCRAGSCVDICNGVSCKSGEICNPRNGRCVEDNCRGLGCATGLLCDPGAGRCVENACDQANCPESQACRAGECEASCADVECRADEVCKSGQCQPDYCAKTKCADGQVCDPDSGDCIDNKCLNRGCANGQQCSPKSGECEAEPCWNLRCPSGQSCSDGECHYARQQPTPTESVEEAAGRLLATGGGGCACSVPSGSRPGSGTRPGWLAFGWVVGLAAVFGLRRSRKRGGAPRRAPWVGFSLLLVLLASLSLLGGCRISPLCIDCVDSGTIGSSEQGATGSDMPGTLRDGGSSGLRDGGAASPSDAGRDGETVTDPMSMMDECIPADEETCNDMDDDCDFKVDEDVVPTENDCNQVGVCVGTVPVCTKGEFICRFGTMYETTESLCDGLDNDCNGKVDESFPMLGSPCEVGVGACKTQGVLRCSTSGKSLSCDATPGQGTQEVCNGLDDDCDGMVDEPKTAPGTNPSYVRDDVVQVRNDLWIYAYEASRVDADATKPGIVSTRACSRAGVLPWTNVTYDEATTACDSVGMRLCGLNDWVEACAGPMGCSWSAATCSSYAPGTCNGHDASTMAGEAETDALKPTGSSPECYADFGNAGQVFDMSGNAKEWTVGDQSPDANPLRGGSYNNNPEALRCDFDFNLATADLRLPNVGFRCCSSAAP